MKTVHIIVSGKVQGVFFRDYACRQAQHLGVSGWVKNLPNGSVEAMIKGRKSDVNRMIEWFHIGSPLSRVTEVRVDEVLPIEKLSNFEIRY
ncbi:acylphosphatase [Desulfopila sp. IMCC35008]|uniref:acylphosphatase n=1 Tax=Desulfopila sp. IMCC35008 TaxID=2653858 RepID=UPI00197A9152|nr:acylphosphatase [Desulfopila sp. IMCC35008]